jgi:hypothetical protein
VVWPRFVTPKISTLLYSTQAHCVRWAAGAHSRLDAPYVADCDGDRKDEGRYAAYRKTLERSSAAFELLRTGETLCPENTSGAFEEEQFMAGKRWCVHSAVW